MSVAPVIREDEARAVDNVECASISLSSASFPLIVRPAKRLNDVEFLRFCAANESLRVERTAEGDLIVMTPAGIRTGNKEGYIFRELDFWVEREKRGIALNSNIGVIFSDGEMRMPDAGWVSDAKWNSLDEAEKERFLPFCPEFVVELRSPSDRVSQIEAKMEFWMSRGAELGWLIDPQRKLAMIYRPDREPETLLSPEFLEGDGPIAGFRLRMQRFWE